MSEQELATEQASRSLLDVEVILVAYRSRNHVEDLLRSWPRDLSVAIVDNSNNSDGVADLVSHYPGTRYVVGGGQGFGRAANLGAFTSDKKYLLFVNPDSRPSAEHLASLVEGVRSDTTVLAHAATTVGADGAVEIGVGGWEPSPRRCLVHATGLHKVWPRAGLFAQPPRGRHEEVDWASGACLAVVASRFQGIGGFDEAFFVYAEDMALGHRGREAGWRSVLREDVVVPHHAGSSGAPSGEMLRLRGASFANYVLKYHSRTSAQTMRALFAAGCLVRAAKSRVLDKDKAEGRLFLNFAAGVLTRRAFVNGVEVAAARYQEVAQQETPARDITSRD